MSTWATIRSGIRTELQEASAGFWSDAELLKWGNKAYSNLIKALRVEGTSTLTLAAGTESYTLPTDFYLARRVEIQSTAGSVTNWINVLPYSLDLRRPGDPTVPTLITGVPSGYYIFGNKIYFVPIPDSAYSGTLYYFKNATPLAADGDSPAYPEGVIATDFDDTIELFVCARALRKRSDASYTTYAGDYNSALAALTGDATDRGDAAPLQVRDDWMSE